MNSRSKPHCLCLTVAVATIFSLCIQQQCLATNSLLARAESIAAGNSPGAPDEDVTNNPAVASQLYSNAGVTSDSSAEATYGSLKAGASINKPIIDFGNPELNFNFATGTAKFSDMLTITGGAGAGTVEFLFQLTGTLTDINAGDSRATASFDLFRPAPFFDGYNESFFVESGTSRTLNEQISTGPLGFTFGQPFQVDVTLVAGVELYETDLGIATADLTNTAQLTTVVVTGATGPVSVTGSSGTSYPIPEPATVVMISLAACTIMLRRTDVARS